MIKANELKLNMKHKQAAHNAAGASNGNHKYLILLNPLLPAGKNLVCSSHDLSSVDKVGSIKRITSDKLNHTCAAISAIK